MHYQRHITESQQAYLQYKALYDVLCCTDDRSVSVHHKQIDSVITEIN